MIKTKIIHYTWFEREVKRIMRVFYAWWMCVKFIFTNEIALNDLALFHFAL